MKILNLYAGIGGNRKLWGDNHQITAIEYNKDIARVYKSFFPNDEVIVADAHQYLLDHYKEFDFIWSSPPCPSHSDIRRCGVQAGQYEALYPDMTLYQEIILLMNFVYAKFVVENVKPYYEPLIQPTAKLHRHYFWSNVNIPYKEFIDKRKHEDIVGSSIVYGFDLNGIEINDKRKILRNMVNPEVGKYILDCLLGKKEEKIDQETLF